MKTGTQKLTVALAWLALSTLNFQLSPVFAQGTVFTCQGRLNTGANPANGSYDLTFSLFNAGSGGSASSGPLTQSAVAVVGGGHNNNADGDYSVVPGGDSNWAPGAYSFAAGRRAKATFAGQFVWTDSQNADFVPASYYGAGNGFGPDWFCVRARGGAIFTATSAYSGVNDQAVGWNPGGGGWTIVSDRNRKDRFAPVDPRAGLGKVSELPTSEWSYKGYSQRHIGPMAQDFHALFPLNDSDKTLNELDLHGVELTAIKGLNQKVDAESAALRARNADLRREIDNLKELVAQLNQRINDGGK